MPRRRSLANLIFALLLGAGFFFAISIASSSIAGGDDAYRHVRFANRLYTETRLALGDPWRLAYLWPKPVDIWFGYHALLGPFTLILPLITAAKLVGSAVWAGSVFAIVQWLEALGARWSRAWALLAATGSGIVLYRAALVRPFLLALLLVILAARFAAEERPWPLAIVSLIHAFSYSIFFLPLMPAGLYLIVRRTRKSALLVAACLAGLALGLAASPFFPENLKFSLAQVYAPLKIGMSQDLDIGGELRPINVFWLLTSLPVLAVWISAVVVFWRRSRAERRPVEWLLLALSFLCLVVSFRTSRMLDFFVPFAAVFAALQLSPWVEAKREKALYLFGFLFLVSAVSFIPAAIALRKAPPITRYRGAAEFLAREGPGAVVFDAKWEEFPFLYYWDWQSRYVTGIDPSFLYINSPRRYWMWRHLSDDAAVTCGLPTCDGEDPTSMEDAVVKELGASFVFLEPERNPRLAGALRASQRMREAYRDDYTSVFAVTTVR